MEQKGFSLIELMVTIVIMGVLAAVAVPKLFGFIDKSKASEISVAAGTYMKLQETYAFEHGKGGTWHEIGYRSPAGNSLGIASSTNFTYIAIENDYNWSAESNVSLNNCPKGSKWYLNYSLSEGAHNIKFWTSSDNIVGCIDELTPSFKRLSNTTTPITTPTKSGGKE
ncbi:type IV pilin protein [Fibrobacter sp. UWB13]|uniref:type IV pilin protein n=1 Tax=Fibrobacter sp. UWB13 TaxID=1896204 RepID=UPI000A0EC422|nr:type II secretion system protein [Fibrobacter sp. UWB13]SMG22460.1 prepilin-type N-terminal cleavage/methylation domain-containing protein [Fibrobacter sp. UWB13]